jgi:hypothetical protein
MFIKTSNNVYFKIPLLVQKIVTQQLLPCPTYCRSNPNYELLEKRFAEQLLILFLITFHGANVSDSHSLQADRESAGKE